MISLNYTQAELILFNLSLMAVFQVLDEFLDNGFMILILNFGKISIS